MLYEVITPWRALRPRPVEGHPLQRHVVPRGLHNAQPLLVSWLANLKSDAAENNACAEIPPTC